MKKINIFLLTFTVISIFLIGYNIVGQKIISASTLTSISNTIDIKNYSINILESKLYENYILTKYTVETLDKSPISEDTVTLNAILSSENSNYKHLDNYIIKESFIYDYKKEFIIVDFFNIINDSSFDLTYKAKLKNTPKQNTFYSNKKSKIKESINPSDKYHFINNIVNIDNINIDVKSLFIEDSYSLLKFTTENKKFIQDDYIIKVKSNNFEDIFFINTIAESNSLYVPMTYKNGEINFNNIEIYLININTNEKKLLYKYN